MEVEASRSLRVLRSALIVVQIAAILVAGLWTYMKFIRTEAPLFKNSAKADHELHAPIPLPDGCRRQFSVTLTNTGKTTFEVKKVVMRFWRFTFDRKHDEPVKVLDLREIEKQPEQFKQEFKVTDSGSGDKALINPYLGQYRPGELYRHTWDLLLDDSGDDWFYVKAEMFIDNMDKATKIAGDWGPVCGESARDHTNPEYD